MIQQYQKINKKNKFFILGFVIAIFSFGFAVFAQSLPTGGGGISTDLFPGGGDSSSALGSTGDTSSAGSGGDSVAPESSGAPTVGVPNLLELPYGGIRVLTIPCTCHSSPSKALVTVFDFVQMRYLKLAYMPKVSVLYMYFDIWSSYYLLGSYNPYVRKTCLVTVTGGDCEPLPDDGLMGGLPGTGTSEPGKVPLIP